MAEVNIPAGYDLTSATCSDGSPVDAISLQANEVVTCTFVNSLRITRTIGFWQTHTAFAKSIFDGLGGNLEIGSKDIDTTNRLFAGFYASIAKESNNKTKRSAIDQARMQMLQQWLGAQLNCQAFGCGVAVQNMLSQAALAWAGTDKNWILYWAGELDAYNNSGDLNAIPNPPGPAGSATPKDSQNLAKPAYSYYDVLP